MGEHRMKCYCKRCKEITGRGDGYCDKCLALFTSKKLDEPISKPISSSIPKQTENCKSCGNKLRNKDVKRGRDTCQRCRKTEKATNPRKHKDKQEYSKEYLTYLKTPGWQAKRKRTLEFYGRRCAVCYKGGLVDIHHRTYNRLGNELDTDLIVLCRECHKLFHGKQ